MESKRSTTTVLIVATVFLICLIVIVIALQPSVTVSVKREVLGAPESPLYRAIAQRQPPSMIRKVIRKHPDELDTFYWQGCSILAMAVRSHHHDAVFVLLEEGADPNGLGRSGEFTPLVCAVSANNYVAARALLDAGGDPSIESPAWGKSPMAAAQEQGKSRFVELFSGGNARH